MLSKSKNILMSLNSKQKSLCQMTTTELYPKEHRSRSRQIFWGAMDFCPIFPKLSRKNSKENDLQKHDYVSSHDRRTFSNQST